MAENYALVEAEKAIKDQNFLEAIEKLETLKQGEEHSKAILLLAKAYLGIENFKLAKQYLEEFTSSFEQLLSSEMYQYLADNANLVKTIFENKGVEGSYLLLAKVYIQLKEFDIGEKKLEKAMSFFPENFSFQNLLSETYIFAKKPEEAKKILDRGIFLGNIDSIEIFEKIWKPRYSYQLFLDSVMNGDIDKLSLFIDNGMDINMQNSEGRTALIYASFLGLTDVVKMLLEEKAELEISDNSGKTAFIHAIEKKHQAIIKLLLNYGAKPHFDSDIVRVKLKEFVDGGDIEILQFIFAHKVISKIHSDDIIVYENDVKEVVQNTALSVNNSETTKEIDTGIVAINGELESFEFVEDDSDIFMSKHFSSPKMDLIGEKRDTIFEGFTAPINERKGLSRSSDVEPIDDKDDDTLNLFVGTPEQEKILQEGQQTLENVQLNPEESRKLTEEMLKRQEIMIKSIDSILEKGNSKEYIFQFDESIFKPKSTILKLLKPRKKIKSFTEYLIGVSASRLENYLKKANVNAIDKMGNTILMSAVQLEEVDYIYQILSRVPDLAYSNKEGKTVANFLNHVRETNKKNIHAVFDAFHAALEERKNRSDAGNKRDSKKRGRKAV